MRVSVGNIRLFQGLTLRQMLWTTAGVTISGFTLLSNADLLIKIPVIVLTLAAVFMIAYYKTTDDPLEVWLMRRLGFERSTRGFVFKGHTAQPPVTVAPRRMGVGTPAHARATLAPKARVSIGAIALSGGDISLAGVILGFWIVASLSALTIYVLRSTHFG
jgi:hypothetical protein